MNVLVVGSGGREHALAWKLAQSPQLRDLHAAPGNPGIARLARCHEVAPTDAEALVRVACEHRIDLVVIGPEAPLVAGLGDRLRDAGIAVFGPSARAARIEGSKAFAKSVLRSAGVPTAADLEEPRAPCVVKADGLAAGKGVFVCRTQADADAAWARARDLGPHVVVEELLEGEEVSVFALCDGRDALPLPAARDAKRLADGDRGPNTGGMGAYSPVPYLDDDDAAEVVHRVHRPVLAELARRGAPFVGLLYAGLMLTEDGPRVLEFNCRFGDPETQVVLPRLEGDLVAALRAAADGRVADADMRAADTAAVTVVVASAGYPDDPRVDLPIEGVADAEASGALVFHAGTARREGRLVSAGGRVLNVTGTGASIEEARERAYAGAALIDVPGAQLRRDIAAAHVHVAA